MIWFFAVLLIIIIIQLAKIISVLRHINLKTTTLHGKEQTELLREIQDRLERQFN